MPFKIEYDSGRDCVMVEFYGVINMPLVREYIATLLPILEETDCKSLFSDCRNAAVQLTSIDIMKFPKMAEASPLTAKLKRAVLASRGTSGYELYEILSKMAGQDVQVFADRETALKWLLEQPAKKQHVHQTQLRR